MVFIVYFKLNDAGINDKNFFGDVHRIIINTFLVISSYYSYDYNIICIFLMSNLYFCL